ncbi:MAG TPA: tetratricopeptide repeat protein [Polyangia bacterium]|nr:tetratricopeptide repeat protein [Polyangia bacterium]
MNPVILLMLLGSLGVSTPGAPSAEEQRLYAEGLTAFGAGDARAAERAWQQGYGIAQDPAFLVRIGEAEEKAGAPAEAVETYRRYLREAPDASDRRDIEQRVARLAQVGAPAGAARAADPGEEPRELGAAPPSEAAPAPPASVARAIVGDSEMGKRAADDGESGWNRYNVTAMSAAGVTVLLLGTAAFFGAEAASKESDVDSLEGYHDEKTGRPVSYSTVSRQYEGALADGRADAHDARIALLGAAGAAAVAAVFFALDAHHGGEATVAFAPAPRTMSGGAVTASWTF